MIGHMKSRFSFSLLPLLAAGLLLLSTSCNKTTTETEADARRTTNKAEQELAELREWAKDKANDVDSTADRKGPQIKDEFKQRSAELEANLDSLSEESKAEYKELKRRFENWQSHNKQRSDMPLQPEKLDSITALLLGSNAALDITWVPTQVRSKYETFIKNVRQHQSSWTAADWDYVDAVYREMNLKKDPLEDNLSPADRLRIKGLQAEYLALEAKKDAKDLHQQVKDN
jgi:flagellar motility protein MotE (MotC chaperone)